MPVLEIEVLCGFDQVWTIEIIALNLIWAVRLQLAQRLTPMVAERRDGKSEDLMKEGRSVETIEETSVEMREETIGVTTEGSKELPVRTREEKIDEMRGQSREEMRGHSREETREGKKEETREGKKEEMREETREGKKKETREGKKEEMREETREGKKEETREEMRKGTRNVRLLICQCISMHYLYIETCRPILVAHALSVTRFQVVSTLCSPSFRAF